MILEVKEFQRACKCILEAVDTSNTEADSSKLELRASNGVLSLNVTNQEYFVSVNTVAPVDANFVAVVRAKLFLPLIAKITTETIDISVQGQSLVIKGNGSYKLPMIYDNDVLSELKPITIENKTTEFTISSDTLLKILKYNGKQIAAGDQANLRAVQKMYYLDEQGCITFTSGACVNSFSLPSPVKILLTEKLVRLFKLFDEGIDVTFSLGIDTIGNSSMLQTKVSFSTPSIKITSILTNDDNLLVQVPVTAIRSRANKNYVNSINIDKNLLMSAIDRILLFTQSANYTGNYATFEFDTTGLTVSAMDGENKEVIPYDNCTVTSPYKTIFDLSILKTVLNGCQEEFLAMSFGDSKATVISRGTIKTVVPEFIQN